MKPLIPVVYGKRNLQVFNLSMESIHNPKVRHITLETYLNKVVEEFDSFQSIADVKLSKTNVYLNLLSLFPEYVHSAS